MPEESRRRSKEPKLRSGLAEKFHRGLDKARLLFSSSDVAKTMLLGSEDRVAEAIHEGIRSKVPKHRSGQAGEIRLRDGGQPKASTETFQDISLLPDADIRARHALTRNLVYAEAAINYAEAKLFLGSDNRPIDVTHGAARSKELGDASAREKMIDYAREVCGGVSTGLSKDAELLRKADHAEAFAMGNCGEHSDVAFKYLLQNTDAKEASVIYINKVHMLVVIGASPSDLRNAMDASGNFPIDQIPKLPKETVICDPWHHEWFPISEWPNKIKTILNTADPGIDKPKYSNENPRVNIEIEGSIWVETIKEYQSYKNKNPNEIKNAVEKWKNGWRESESPLTEEQIYEMIAAQYQEEKQHNKYARQDIESKDRPERDQGQRTERIRIAAR